MHLEGSCHCGAVRFQLDSRHLYPYQRCYCSICRKTAGSGGFSVNLSGDALTLHVDGEAHVRTYQARIRNPGQPERTSPARRHFCGECGSALWLWDPRWPDLVHPYASAIDTTLPEPPERTHIMLEFAPPWVQPDLRPGDRHHQRYPEESIAEWHERLGVTDDSGLE